MKRYTFALEPVLRVRRIVEDQAKADLARTEQQRLEAERAAARREEAHRAAEPASGKLLAAASFLAAREQHERTAAALEGAKRDSRAAALAAEASRRALVAARGDVIALENLDDRRRDEHAKDAQREETVETDDLVTGRRRRERR